MENTTRDTSQNGDFENFRNCLHNSRHLCLTSAFFSELPSLQVNKIRFDFVNVNRPVPGIEACSDEGIDNMLEAIFFPDLEHDGEEGEEQLQEEEEDDDDPWVIAERARKAEEARLVEEEKKVKEAKAAQRKGGALLAGLKRQEELTRLAQARHDEKLNRKVESLHTITERLRDDGFRAQWQSMLDSTREVYQLAHADGLEEAVRAAAIDVGETIGKGEAPSAAVLGHKIFRDARNMPVSAADVHTYIERVRKAVRRAKRETMHAGGHKSEKHSGDKVCQTHTC